MNILKVGDGQINNNKHHFSAYMLKTVTEFMKKLSIGRFTFSSSLNMLLSAVPWYLHTKCQGH